MVETPSWLTPGNSNPAPAPAAATLDHGAAVVNTGVTQDDEKDLPGVILTMRLANMGAAAALITISVREIVNIIFMFFLRECELTGTTSIFGVGSSRDAYSTHLLVCIRHLCYLWWFIDLLLGDSTQVPACDDCCELWLFVQLGLAVPLLPHIGIGDLVIR